jgi:hypothetical protein
MTTFLFANIISSGVKIIVGEFSPAAAFSPASTALQESHVAPRPPTLPAPPACLACLPVCPPACRPPAGEHLSRRNRVIMGFSLALGIGVTLVPEW